METDDEINDYDCSDNGAYDAQVMLKLYRPLAGKNKVNCEYNVYWIVLHCNS